MLFNSHISSIFRAFFGCAAVALPLWLSSCSSDEPASEPTPREITFKGASSAASRAAEPLTSDLDTDYKMWVTAMYRHENAGFFYLKDSRFIFDTDFNLNRWRCENHAYYPLSGKLDFVAYATNGDITPGNVTYAPGKNNTNIPDSWFLNRLTMEYKTEGHILDGSSDILASAVAQDVECGFSEDPDITLQFHHLTSRIRFRFYADTREASEFLWITGVELKDTSFSGTVRLKKDNKEDPWTITWPELTPKTTIRKDAEISPLFGPGTPPCIDFYLPAQTVNKTLEPGDPPLPSFEILYKYMDNGIALTDEMTFVESTFPSPTSGNPDSDTPTTSISSCCRTLCSASALSTTTT